MNPLCCIAPVSVDREKPPTGNVIGKPPDIVFEPLKNQQHHSQITGNNGGINLGFSRHSYSAQVSSVSSSTTALDQVHHHEAEDVMVMSGRDSRVYGSNGGGAIAGILYKWVNYGKGWRSRWFVLEDGVLSYYKLHGPDKITVSSSGSGPGSSPRREKIGVKVIGEESVKYMRKNNSWGKNGTNNISGISANYSNGFRVNNSYSNLSTYNKQWKPYGEVHLKVSSIRASKSDDKRLSIFTGTKTLHLRCVSKEDRATWIESLLAAKDLFPRVLTSNEFAPEDIVVSTDKLRRRMLQEGIAEPVIDDCESIVLIEVSELKNQFKALQQKHVSLLETLRRLEGTGHEQSMYFPLYRLPLASSYDEVQVNRPEVVDARNQPAQRENQRQLLEEDDFMVSIFSQPGIKLYNGKTQNNMHEGGRNHKGSGHSTALPSPGEKETDQRNRGDLNSKQQMKNLDGRSSRVYDAPARHSSDVLMREKDDWRKDACAQSGYPDRYRVINLEKTNSNLRQDHEDGVSATGATHLVGVSDQPLEYPGKEISLKLNHAPPVGSNYRGDNETGNGMQRVEEYRTLEKESLDRGDDVSETSMEDTSDLDITPDDVVRIIGRKHFWKARTAISTALHFFHLRTSIEAALSFGLLHVPIIQEINFGWQIVVGSIIGFCGAAFGSVSGVGGGGIFVPMLSLVIGFDPKSATAISKCPREVTGAVDLITHYKLLSHHEFFCKKILFVSIADTHYL